MIGMVLWRAIPKKENNNQTALLFCLNGLDDVDVDLDVRLDLDLLYIAYSFFSS